MRRTVFIGKVLENSDPDVGGGVKVQVNDLVDGAALDDEAFAPGRFPFAGNDEGMYFAPQVGSILELEVVDDEEQAVEDLGVRWVGMIYTSEDAIPAEFRSAPTTRGGVKFGANVVLLDKAADVLAAISPNVRLGEEAAPHPVLRGDTFNTELSTFLDDLKTYVDATAGLPGMAGPAATFAVRILALKAKLSTWLSTRVKTE